MKVIVDTDVWSEAFRKQGTKSHYVSELRRLIKECRVQLIGPIRQEILCGVRDEQQFERMQESLNAFPDKSLESGLFILAAKFFNLCRSRGVQGSNTDFLICACSVTWRYPVLTKDRDFRLYRDFLPLEILEPKIS